MVGIGGQVAFRAPRGLPGASVVAVGAVLLLLLSLVSGCGLMLLLWLHSGLFDVVCVALFPPPQCALGVSCRCWLHGALFVCSCSCAVGRARGPAVRLGVCLLGFPAAACAVTPLSTIASLCNTHGGNRCSSANNAGNPKSHTPRRRASLRAQTNNTKRKHTGVMVALGVV